MPVNEQHDPKRIEAPVATEVAGPLARGLRDSRASVTYRWLDRIQERVELEHREVFPSDQLLDHVPLLIDAIAEFMEDPSEEGTAADAVMAKAAELGEMRFHQGFSTYQVLLEYEILGGVILSHLRERVMALGFTPKPDDMITVSHRVYRALSKVQQATAARHMALLEERRHDMDQRLRLIHDMLDTLAERADGDMRIGLADLRELADTGFSSRRRGVPLRAVVREAVRRIRPIAVESDVEVQVSDEIPSVDVMDAQVEQCLVVYLTNALRHCSEIDGECTVEVSSSIEPESGGLVVRVRNTGQVVEAVEDIAELSDQDQDRIVDGERSVGLRFARDIIAAIGGRTWAEPSSDPAGSIFALALPARRADDEDGVGSDQA